ncbi:MAG: glycoside hydrolase family 92 protein [Bacteroidales bacterium]|nr:glycoside hydrolase family 92 protein [Bacteroidales bacterium]
MRNLLNLKRTAAIVFIGIVCFSSLSAKDNTRYVNLFMGTAGDNGQLDPAACVPYGEIRIAPDCTPRSHSGYDYDIDKISGFSINRLSGIGCGGAGGNLSIKPDRKDADLHLIKNSETAVPGYYAVDLDNGVGCEFTASYHCGFHHYTFNKNNFHCLTLNVGSGFTNIIDAKYNAESSTEITGFVNAGNTCNNGAYKLYFVLKSNKPFKCNNIDEKIAELIFDKNIEDVDIRISVSPISFDDARNEMIDFKDCSFKKAKLNARKLWKEKLSKIEISTNDEETKTIFYTSLYRVFLSPFKTTSKKGEFLATDGTIQMSKDYTYYSSWSMWDSYRTKFPLITLLDSDEMSDICKSLCNLFIYGKKDWATKFESAPTVRTEKSCVVLLDAYNKGITDFDLNSAYPGIVEEIEALKTQRPDQALETSIDLWAAAKLADIIGKDDYSKKYSLRSMKIFEDSWQKSFKNVDDSFVKMKGSGLYQGTKWQYRWAAPQYIEIMKQDKSGALLSELEYFFNNDLNNQGNEPGIHALYIFNLLGKPELAQKTAIKLLTSETTHIYGGNAEYPTPIKRKIFKNEPKGLLPEMDEDDGTMSAWYVFSSIGLFPLVIGEPEYQIVSPIFDNICINLDNGRKIKISAKGRKDLNQIIKSISFNGEKINDYHIDHNKLVKGGKLLIEY